MKGHHFDEVVRPVSDRETPLSIGGPLRDSTNYASRRCIQCKHDLRGRLVLDRKEATKGVQDMPRRQRDVLVLSYRSESHNWWQTNAGVSSKVLLVRLRELGGLKPRSHFNSVDARVRNSRSLARIANHSVSAGKNLVDAFALP